MRRTSMIAAVGLALLCAAATSWPRPAAALSWPGGEAALFASLENGDANTRLAALRALSKQRAHVDRALRLALDDDSVEVRAEALRLAAVHRVASAIPHALDATRSVEALIRNRSCAVIGLARATTHLSALVRLAGDSDAEVRMAALTALAAWSDDDEASAALAGHVDDAAPNVRARAITLLAEHRGSRAMGAIAGKLQDSNVEVRLTVARSLGDLGDTRAASVLVLGLRDSSVDVVRESARSLGALRAELATSALIALLPSRQSETVRAAVLALGRIATPEAIAALVAELGRATTDRAGLEETPIRRALLSAGGKARLPLENVLSSGAFGPATSAAWVLARLPLANGAPLAEALRRGRIDPAVALDGLSRTGGEPALLAGLTALRDPRAAVRSAARAATSAGLSGDGHRGDGRAVEPLLAAIALATGAPHELAELLRLLGMTRADRAIDTLRIFLAHDDARLALAATEGLAHMTSPRAMDALVSLLTHRTAEIRIAAAGALRRSAPISAAERIVNLLNHEPSVDRTTALSALAGPVSRGATPPNLDDALAHAHGAERAAWLELAALAAPSDLARRLHPDLAGDRRALTQVPWAKSSATTSLARSLLDDADAAVRAHAAWQLGALGDASDLPRLAEIAKRDDPAAAANAVAAFAHLAAPDAIATLCAWASTGSPYVKANALAGIGLIGGKCPAARAAFAKSQPSWLQLAAANALGEDGCAELRERDDGVAFCSPSRRSQTDVALVFVYGSHRTPVADTPFSVQTQDGFIRSGWTDGRGAFSQPDATGDALRLLPSAPSLVTAD